MSKIKGIIGLLTIFTAGDSFSGTYLGEGKVTALYGGDGDQDVLAFNLDYSRSNTCNFPADKQLTISKNHIPGRYDTLVSMLLMAYATGQVVKVHSYSRGCSDGASYVEWLRLSKG